MRSKLCLSPSPRYTPYGDLLVLDANFANDTDGVSDFANATTFTGRLLDTEYGQYYFRNRYYGSGLGRFGSRDFLSYTDRTLNLYTYVGGHPLNRLDPLGLDWLDTVANFGAGWSDTLTLGATDFVREGLGINDGIRHDSTAYGVGVGVGVVHGAAISFGAGGVVGGSGRLIYGGVRLYDTIDTGLTIVGAGVEIYENGRIGVWTAVELGLLAVPGGNRLPSTHAIDNAPVSGIACAVKSMARSASRGTNCPGQHPQPIIGPARPYNEAPPIPGHDRHHLDPPLGRPDPSYSTGETVYVLNENQGGARPGGVNVHTGPGGLQQALNHHITQDLGYTIDQWNSLPDSVRRLHLARYYASLFKK